MMLPGTAIEVVSYLFNKELPTSSPSAISVVVIFRDVTEPLTPLAPPSVKYMGEGLRSDLSCITTQGLKHFGKVIDLTDCARLY